MMVLRSCVAAHEQENKKINRDTRNPAKPIRLKPHYSSLRFLTNTALYVAEISEA